jgi:hypothetical protein
MVQAEILLSLVLAAVGAWLLIGVAREPARRRRGPGGVRAELATTTGDIPDGRAAPAIPPEAAQPAARVVVIGAAPAAPALPPTRSTARERAPQPARRPAPQSTRQPAPQSAAQSARKPAPPSATPLPTPDLPVRRPQSAAPPAPGLSNGVRNSRFARYDRSGRPATMGSPYLR